MAKMSPLNKLNNQSSVFKEKQEGQKLKSKLRWTKTLTRSPLTKINNREDEVKNDLKNQEVEQEHINTSPKINYEKYEEAINVEDMLEQRKEKKKQKYQVMLVKIFSTLTILGCVYIIFLVYGALNTDYIYDEQGNVIAQQLTFDEIKTLDEFEDVAQGYRQARTIYESILLLDYRIASGLEDPVIIAPEYEKLLDTIEQLSIHIQAKNISAKYTQVNNMLQAWVQTDAAVYCQRMSEAITQNNADYGTQAVEYKTVMYNDFLLISENLAALGGTVDGADIADIISWSPETYVRNNVGALDS